MAGTGARHRFAGLHDSGTFLMPNAWDVGSARILEWLGFQAIATTSSGLAASLGRLDQQTSLDELAGHVAAIASEVGVPISVDAEDCYGATTPEVATTVALLAEAGASGVSIEDYTPGRGILPIKEAVARVAAAVEEGDRHGLTITARAENHLYGVDDLDDTIARLRSYGETGARCLYAPGLTRPDEISRVVTEVGGAVNVLLLPDGPSVGELTALGVRRLSTGGALAFAAYGALVTAARELIDAGTSTYLSRSISGKDRRSAFGEAAG
jgi:2-methylisocitrate lyase-like PEP mutase family enzyme